MVYSYHNTLKQRLKTSPYICAIENGTQFAYRFIFPELGKSYPIREYRLKEYEKYINIGSVEMNG